MQTVKRDQICDVLRGSDWRRAHVINVLPGWVSLQFLVADNPVKASAAMVALAEMQNAEISISRDDSTLPSQDSERAMHPFSLGHGIRLLRGRG